MRSEYLAYLCRWYCWCNNLFERKNKDNVFLIISALSIIWSQNWSLQQILNSVIDLKFIRRSRDHLRHASWKWLSYVYHNILWVQPKVCGDPFPISWDRGTYVSQEIMWLFGCFWNIDYCIRFIDVVNKSRTDSCDHLL